MGCIFWFLSKSSKGEVEPWSEVMEQVEVGGGDVHYVSKECIKRLVGGGISGIEGLD